MVSDKSILTQIIDKIRSMNEEQQKLLWLQLNQDAIFSASAKADASAKQKISMDEIVKLTRYVRGKKKKA